MSDRALALKAGFGALVMVFCAVTWWARKPAEPSAPMRQPYAAVTHSALPEAPPIDPAPLDVQDDAPPVRVQVSLYDIGPGPVVRQPLRAKVHHPVPQMHAAARPRPPRLHAVAVRRKVSPYAIGRKHYPVGPGERWALRDAP